jgi:nitrite reductase/ring-hydroxylating ferredoxin subunit
MGQWVRIGSVDEMPAEGQLKELLAAGRPVCVARITGALAALDNECPHRGAPLAEGTIEDGHIVCPWHGWCFDPRTGQEATNPAGRAKVYPIQLQGEDVLCEV